MEKFKYNYMSDYNNQSDYTKVHVVSTNKIWHIYWNLFLKSYQKWGIKFFNMPISKYKVLAFYFGNGEFVISIR